MADNVIAIMLPEYDDAGNNFTSDDWKSQELIDDVEMAKRIKCLAEFVDFFSDENCHIIYDSQNVLAFTYVLRTMPECYPSREAQLRTALKGTVNWRYNRLSNANDEYYIGYVKLKDEIRCELAARWTKDPGSSHLIVAHLPDYKGKVWTISSAEIECDVHSCKLDPSDVFNWLSEHHKPERKYNWNPKHGEYGRRAHNMHGGKEVALLLCSREHADELLPKAIGLRGWDFLYNYDAAHGKYMEYKAECKQDHLDPTSSERRYHSYHLNSDITIPQRIIRKLKYLENQQRD